MQLRCSIRPILRNSLCMYSLCKTPNSNLSIKSAFGVFIKMWTSNIWKNMNLGINRLLLPVRYSTTSLSPAWIHFEDFVRWNNLSSRWTMLFSYQNKNVSLFMKDKHHFRRSRLCSYNLTSINLLNLLWNDPASKASCKLDFGIDAKISVRCEVIVGVVALIWLLIV